MRASGSSSGFMGRWSHSRADEVAYSVDALALAPRRRRRIAPPAPEAVKENLDKVVNATYAEFGADAQLIAHAEDPNADRAKLCAITISVYERIMQLPPEDSSALIRAMSLVR